MLWKIILSALHLVAILLSHNINFAFFIYAKDDEGVDGVVASGDTVVVVVVVVSDILI